MIQTPKKTTGTSVRAAEWNVNSDRARSLRPSASGLLVSHTTHGIIHETEPELAQVGDVFPFKIIQTENLKYQVVDGPSILITTGEPVTITDLDTDLTLTSGVSFYWIYLDITDATTAAIATSATTLTWDSYKVPIGYVDTVEDPPVIHQFIHDNIFAPCVV